MLSMRDEWTTGLKMHIFVRSPAHLECLFLHCNTSRSRPALRLPTLDIPGWLWLDQRRWSVCRRGYWTLSNLVVNMTNLIIAKCQRRNNESRRRLFFRRSSVWGAMAPSLPPSGSATECDGNETLWKRIKAGHAQHSLLHMWIWSTPSIPNGAAPPMSKG